MTDHGERGLERLAACLADNRTAEGGRTAGGGADILPPRDGSGGRADERLTA